MSARNLFIIAGIVVVVIVIFLLFQFGFNPLHKTATFVAGGHTFHVDVAKTEQEKQTGLSGRGSVAADRGMVFLFDQPANVPFWMKQMRFPIDIVFIRSNHVVTVDSNVQPPKSTSEPDSSLILYYPTEPADTVVELKAGQAQKYNMKPGTPVTLKL